MNESAVRQLAHMARRPWHRWELWFIIGGERQLISRHTFRFMASIERDFKDWRRIELLAILSRTTVDTEIRRVP